MPRRKYAWEKLSDEQLLKQRLSSLRVKVEGTWLEDCLSTLNEELQAKGIRLRPHAWISSEWFSPADVPGIAIPFYLAHPRLMKLEKKMMLDVEGGTWSECMAILRHEAGHAVQHAWQPQRRRRWQQLFGLSSKRYPRHYRPNPASRRFVQHLRLWYAQSHPDEDFAETFAVWLRPRSNWRTRYAGWPALQEAGICRRADGRDRGEAAAGHDAGARRSAALSSARRWASTTGKSRRSTPSRRRKPTTAISPVCSPPIHGIGGSRRPRSLSGGTAPRSGSWSRGGRARTSLRSMPFSTT